MYGKKRVHDLQHGVIPLNLLVAVMSSRNCSVSAATREIINQAKDQTYIRYANTFALRSFWTFPGVSANLKGVDFNIGDHPIWGRIIPMICCHSVMDGDCPFRMELNDFNDRPKTEKNIPAPSYC